MTDLLNKMSHNTPLFAVLRGVRPDEASDVAGALYDAGVRILEVTLNSPEPLKSIENIARDYAGKALIGAGTVTDAEDVAAVKEAGGEIIISPHTDLEVIEKTKKHGLLSLPGCFTPSEAYAALNAGADGLKLFPAEVLSPAAIKAMRTVMPQHAKLFVVGGVSAENMVEYVHAGADGFGVGSSLYKPGKDLDSIARDAQSIMQALNQALGR